MNKKSVAEITKACHACQFSSVQSKLLTLAKEETDPVLSDQLAYLSLRLEKELAHTGIGNFYSKVDDKSLELNMLFQKSEAMKKQLLQTLKQLENYFSHLEQMLYCPEERPTPYKDLYSRIAKFRALIGDTGADVRLVNSAVERFKNSLNNTQNFLPASEASEQNQKNICFIKEGCYHQFIEHIRTINPLSARLMNIRNQYQQYQGLQHEIAEKAEFFHLEDTYGAMAEQVALRFEQDINRLLEATS